MNDFLEYLTEICNSVINAPIDDPIQIFIAAGAFLTAVILWKQLGNYNKQLSLNRFATITNSIGDENVKYARFIIRYKTTHEEIHDLVHELMNQYNSSTRDLSSKNEIIMKYATTLAASYDRMGFLLHNEKKDFELIGYHGGAIRDVYRKLLYLVGYWESRNEYKYFRQLANKAILNNTE